MFARGVAPARDWRTSPVAFGCRKTVLGNGAGGPVRLRRGTFAGECTAGSRSHSPTAAELARLAEYPASERGAWTHRRRRHRAGPRRGECDGRALEGTQSATTSSCPAMPAATQLAQRAHAD